MSEEVQQPVQQPTQQGQHGNIVRIQLFPHSDGRPSRAFVFKPIELDLGPGSLLKFGRKIDSKKEGPGGGSRWTRDEQIAQNASVQELGQTVAPLTNVGTEALQDRLERLSISLQGPNQGPTLGPVQEPVQEPKVTPLPNAQQARQLISFRSKVVSRSHAELRIDKDGQVFFRDARSSSGTFLNRLRLSPSGKESRPYPLKSGDIIQLGVDYQGRQEEIYKCVAIKIFITDGNGIRPRLKSTKWVFSMPILCIF
jgi:hypothetical protein